MRADDFLDDAGADAFLDGTSSLPTPKGKPDPSLKDRVYSALNGLFRDQSVMEGYTGPTTQPFDPVATAKVDRIIQAPQARSLPAQGPAVGILEKGLRGGVGQLAKSGLGLVQGVADATGMDSVGNIAAGAASRANQFASNPLQQTSIAGFTPNSIIQDLPDASAGAISSIISNLPALAANVVAPGSGLPLMGVQSAAGEYSDGRASGLNPMGALLRAVPYGAAEVLGEKVGGFNGVTQGLRRAIDEGSIVPAARAMVGSGLREIPGEELTTALQFGIDKLPGIGTNQEATGADLAKQMKDTALQTLLQSGGMVGAGSVLGGMQKNTAAPTTTPIEQSAPADISTLTDAIASTASIDSKLQPKLSADDFLDAPVDLQQLKQAAQEYQPRAPTEQDMIGRAESAPHTEEQADAPAPSVPDPAALTEPAPVAMGRADAAVPAVTEQAASDSPSPAPAVEPSPAQEPAAERPVPDQLSERATQIETPTEGLRPGDIVTAEGKPFKTKPQALVEARLAGKGWTIKKGGGGFVVRYQPPSAAQIANTQRLTRNQGTVDPEHDSLFAAIAKLGGMHPDQLTKEWGYDPKEISTIRGAGIKRIAHRNGKSLDRMAESLAELGYLSYDENGKHDLSEFNDLFDTELRGDKHYTPQGFAKVGQAMQEAQHQEWLSKQQIDESGINEVSDDAHDAIEEFLDEHPQLTEADDAAIEAAFASSAGMAGQALEAAGGATQASDRSIAETAEGTPRQPGATESSADAAKSAGLTSRQALNAERRKDDTPRKSVSDMTPEEMRRALVEDELTGLGNRRAYLESPKKAHQASIDIDSLKWVNDHMGHESGDQLLALFGSALREETADGYHISGDEFVAQFDDEPAGRALLERVRARLTDAVIEVTRPDGTVVSKQGVEFSYGIAPTLKEADNQLLAEKARREQAGERAGRGQEPAGVSRRPAQGQPHHARLSATEEVTPDTGEDIPASYYASTRVMHDVWVTDEGRFEAAEVTAQEALDSVREDLDNYQRLLDCMRG